MQYHFARRSRNGKTGSIPVTTTSEDTCSDVCPFKGNGSCYAAANFHLSLHWQKVNDGRRGDSLDALCAQIAKLPDGQLWRHNQAGDLPGTGNQINTTELGQLVRANQGKRGFTYTHKPMDREENRASVAAANAQGFTVNLSGNTAAHADSLADLAIAPVVTVLPSEYGRDEKTESLDAYRARLASLPQCTPQGRRIVVCPATYRDEITCASCGLCQHANRQTIVGFPAHGARASAADTIAKGQ